MKKFQIEMALVPAYGIAKVQVFPYSYWNELKEISSILASPLSKKNDVPEEQSNVPSFWTVQPMMSLA